MTEKIKNILGVSLAFGAVIFAFSAFVYAGSFAKSSDPARSFSVSAEGSVVAVPDIVEFNYSIITEGGEDLLSLQEDNSQKSNEINEYLKGEGIDEEDIRTVSYNISPRYQTFRCPPEERGACPPREIVGYTINQSVRVKVRDLSEVGNIISGVVGAGANSTSGLTFSIDDIESVQDEARDEAVQKAKEKAEAMADSAGFKLGDIISINENFHSPFYATRGLGEEMAFDDGFSSALPPAIEPGSQEVSVNVNVRYEIR